MRLAFYRAAQAVHLPATPLPFQSGVPVSCGSTLRDHLAADALVGNSGNMIHRMAMIQMLRFDRARSSQIHLLRTIAQAGGPRPTAEMLNASFDGLVITMSNVLRVGATEPGIAELLRDLSIPIYCFGVGLQDDLPLGDASSLSTDILELVQVLDQKAVIFGVRGDKTRAWLESIGIRNAIALGCPSMFAYPRNVLSVRSPEQPARVITAGHMSLTSHPRSRIHRLIRGFRGMSPAYVFQGEVARYKELLDQEGLYDEATQTFSHAVMSEYLEMKLKVTVPFSRYYSFADATAWRQAYTGFDVFAGDRIHGGVAALQVGVPALILYDDARVLELASYHGIPSCSLQEFEEIGCRAALEKHLGPEAVAHFHERYLEVLEKFEAAIRGAGLSLVNRTGTKSEPMLAASNASRLEAQFTN
ncbi:polysaccharide pyruvyl transferase family protein [Ramlibacter sp.]|uniref:polysaccharide pyruvyl transferase family protein n=1 Tax=Ramlibacter sp. TaxID=1917967 RepID=UPI002FC761B2